MPENPPTFPSFAGINQNIMAEQIKFGTDGWRAVIAREFTVDNVARVAQATADWLKAKNLPKRAVVGHDNRFAGELFADTVARVFLLNGLEVHLADGPVSTPMISLATKELNCGIGVIITASHNPPEYNGFKLKGTHGGPLLEADVKAVEKLIADAPPIGFMDADLNLARAQGQLHTAELMELYIGKVEKAFDLDLIRNSGLEFAYDAMYGSGAQVMRRLFPDITFMHAERNPLFDGIPPEPVLRNLRAFQEVIKLSGDIDCGLATDGDADRIALFDHEGNYIDSHHILMLLIHYLAGTKKWKGMVGMGFSSSVKVKRLCEHYNIPYAEVMIGFKHLCGVMLDHDVLVGGEESGGIAVKGHIPERDGIWNGLVIWEMMAMSGKSLRALIEEMYAITGPFAFERIDLNIPEGKKKEVVENCRAGHYSSFNGRQVIRVEDMDGYKYWLSDHDWVMVRPSGTEPVLRTYAEAATTAEAFAILKDCHKELGV